MRGDNGPNPPSGSPRRETLNQKGRSGDLGKKLMINVIFGGSSPSRGKGFT